MSCDAGVEESETWSEHRTREGVSYYHNSQTGNSQWERPAEFKGQSRDLGRDEIQVGLLEFGYIILFESWRPEPSPSKVDLFVSNSGP